MKQLSDVDLEKMLGNDFAPDDSAVKKQVQQELKLSRLIPESPKSVPKHITLDLHQKTEEQAWEEINKLINSGARTATIITGASGILKTKFKDWITNGVIAPKITECCMINNGAYSIKIKRIISIIS